jgi:hypothetical protein
MMYIALLPMIFHILVLFIQNRIIYSQIWDFKSKFQNVIKRYKFEKPFYKFISRELNDSEGDKSMRGEHQQSKILLLFQ